MSNLSDCTVLIVDDEEEAVKLLQKFLKDEYQTAAAMNGQEAIAYVQANKPDLILLDIMLPDMNGYEVCRRLKNDEATQDIPVIFITGKDNQETNAFEAGGVDYISKPVNPRVLLARVRNQLELEKGREELEREKDALQEKVIQYANDLTRSQEVTVQSLATLAEYRDPETGGHIKRTQHYIRALSERLRQHPRFKKQLDPEVIDLLARSAPLHDIGKVGVPDSILFKPDKLTTDEFDEIKKHPEYGRDALDISPQEKEETFFLGFGMEIAYTHHEKWDGSGYPRGIAEEDIPLSGRLMALADIYDALISKRIYKSPFSHTKAVSIIEKSRETHLDPDIVDAFLHLEDEFRRTALTYADFDEEREALET